MALRIWFEQIAISKQNKSGLTILSRVVVLTPYLECREIAKETGIHSGIVEAMRPMVLCVGGYIFRSISRLGGGGALELLSFVVF